MDENVRLALALSYLGGGFCGWQRQRQGRTVQGELEAALARLYGHEVSTTGAGRTDAGVHALAQVVHLDVPGRIPPPGVRAALNALLPPDVRVLSARRVPTTFHARASATGKRYRYRLAWGPPVPPWEAQRCWLLPRRPDLAAARACLERARGTHDFAAFALSGHSGQGRRGTTRTVFVAALRERGRTASVVLEGDGFLRGMVRRIVGAMVEVGRGAQPEAWFANLLSVGTGDPPAPTAPPHGLTLERVFYPPAHAQAHARLRRP